uniref:Uncharacterized protein n=1 Tax=Plectus sambesii TaxID=2011161 RepID=A0A914W5Q4_9BILA
MRAALNLLLCIFMVSSPSTCNRSSALQLDEVILLTQHKCPTRCEHLLALQANPHCLLNGGSSTRSADMRHWPTASVQQRAAGCAPIADVALQPERSAGRFSHSSALSRRRWSAPIDRVDLMRCPSTSYELGLFAVVRVLLGALVAVGAVTAVVANLGFDLITTSVAVGPAVCDGSDPSNISAEAPTELNSSEVIVSALPVSAPPSGQPIAPFDEWTKEKLLKQDQNKIANNLQYHQTHQPTAVTENADGSGASPGELNGAPKPSPPAVAVLIDTQRNYASKECGAKVLLGNPEAENRAAILNAPTVVKAKKKRKKSKKISIAGTADTWDSAMESTSSVRSTGTPTPSELSSEIELPSPALVFTPSDRDSTPRGDLCPPTHPPVALDPWTIPPCRRASTSSLPTVRKKRHHVLLTNKNMFRVLQSPLKRKHQV